VSLFADAMRAARAPFLIPHALSAVPESLRGSVVALGNFDGLHGGHRALLELALGEARHLGVPAVVLTFEPHPRTVFRPDKPVFRLTPLPAKARLLAALGLDGLVVAEFDRTFAATTADTFIDDVLIGRLDVAAVVVGYNFRFGYGREGTAPTLAGAGSRRGFAVGILDEVSERSGVPASSSVIRDDLAAGDIASANARLGYRWFIVGTVIEGDRRGRELGFPTANIALGSDCRLRHGVYAVRMRRADGTVLDGVASYGRRPTFDNGAPLLEVHAFDFAGDLYGEEVIVSFFGWIRPELKFDSAQALITAMQGDAVTAREILSAADAGTQIDRALAADTG
jgi:riboflavin kinase/FMN adenylyltransferase